MLQIVRLVISIENEPIRILPIHAVAIYCERLSDSEITYVLKNKIGFKEGETVTFEESRVQGIVTTLETPSKTVTAGYNFDTHLLFPLSNIYFEMSSKIYF